MRDGTKLALEQGRPDGPTYLDGLNDAQRAAVLFGYESSQTAGRAELPPPLLIIAGAGSGKTRTLTHRVAHLIASGADPARILMLTFTRRAADEMSRRAHQIVSQGGNDAAARTRIQWAGTFHGIANRLLRYHAESVGLDPSFTVLDRGDSADLLDLLRNERGLSQKSRRFPKKGTCLAIYSHVVNSQGALEDTLERAFPWCEGWDEELRGLFGAYVEAKQRQHVLDYDDLLLYWHHMMQEPSAAQPVAERFDHILVDEYQDTNALQAGILLGLKPDGRGLTVVGDDAQSIYAFRAATVENITGFPEQFEPPAQVVSLERNYRSTQPILDACNAVIAQGQQRFSKRLHSSKSSEEAPFLVTAEDETCQVDHVVGQVLAYREAGIALHRQAVLFRTSHHSDALEVELGRCNIPFVKFGGLKFLEASHVKDLLCLLRWAENPRDAVAAFRGLQLLPGIGPGYARRAIAHLEAGGFDLSVLAHYTPPASAARDWPQLCSLVQALASPSTPWAGQVERVRNWYQPHLERIYDSAGVRAGDLEELEHIAVSYTSRERFLSELTLDPPSATGDEAGPPRLDEDYLILSTIHSAKGQEWDAVFLLNAADGCIPSDMATGDADQIEEERRLLYVAMTRARDHLHVVHPLRFYVRGQHRTGDRHLLAPVSRFLTGDVARCFERRSAHRMRSKDGFAALSPSRVDVASRLREMWT